MALIEPRSADTLDVVRTDGHQLRPMAEDSPAAAGLNILPGASDPGVGTPPPRSACPKRLLTASWDDDVPATLAPVTVTTAEGCARGSSASPP